MSVTIYDVAREAKVSMATVSRVINGNPNVKPSTRRKVIAVIEKLNYRPNAVARGLARRKTTTVGVIIPDISSIYYSELARGIGDIATMYNYDIILTNSDQNKQKELHQLNTMLSKQVDGIVFMSGNITDEHLVEFKQSRIPIVLACSIDKTKKTASVNIDYEQAVFDVVQSFISRGHERIALVTGPLTEPINKDLNLKSYQAALQRARISQNENYIIEGNYTYESGITAAKQLFSLEQFPTAVYVCGDEMALGVIHGVQDLGYNVPADLEVISSDNTRLTKMVRPQLTAVAQPLYDIGAVSMRLLTKYMNNEEVDDHFIVLPHRIDYRSSTN